MDGQRVGMRIMTPSTLKPPPDDLKLTKRSGEDIERGAKKPHKSKGKKFAEATNNWLYWVELRRAIVLKIAIKQACHHHPGEIGPQDIVAVNDKYSIDIDDVVLLLEKYCDKFEPMNEEDLEKCVMRYVAEAKYSKHYQKQNPHLPANPLYHLSTHCKLLYAEHILAVWGEANPGIWAGPGNPPVEQFLPQLKHYIDQEVGQRADAGDTGEHQDKRPMTNRCDAALQRLYHEWTGPGNPPVEQFLPRLKDYVGGQHGNTEDGKTNMDECNWKDFLVHTNIREELAIEYAKKLVDLEFDDIQLLAMLTLTELAHLVGIKAGSAAKLRRYFTANIPLTNSLRLM